MDFFGIFDDDDEHFERRVLAGIHHIIRRLDRIERKVDVMSAEQDAIDQAVATLGVDTQALAGAAQRIEDEIAALQSQGVDVTGLQAAVAAADTAVGTVVSIVPAPAP